MNDMLNNLKTKVENCTKCKLHKSRNNVVLSDGPYPCDIALIGEGPGQKEDEKGIPFVGRAGRTLDAALRHVGLERKEVWIGNVVKCRPPGNRNPKPEEEEACLPYLKFQLKLVQPKVIVCLGAVSSKALLNISEGITKERGRVYEYEGIKAIPTLHPSYILRNVSAVEYLWEDLMKAKRLANGEEEV